VRIVRTRATLLGTTSLAGAALAAAFAVRLPVDVTLHGTCLVMPRERWSLSEIRPGTFESRTVDESSGGIRDYRLYQYDRPALVELRFADPAGGPGEDDTCPAGAVVARVGASTLEIELAERATAVELARARLAALRAGAKPEEISRARLAVEESRAQQAASAIWYERQTALYRAGQITQDQWEQASITCRLRDLDVQLAEADLRVATSAAGPEAVAAGEVAVENLEGELKTLREIAGRQEIRSPLGGRLEPGRLPGELLTVTSTGRVVIAALIPQRDTHAALRAQRLTASIPGTTARRWTADVVRIDPRPVETAGGPMMRVFAVADDAGSLLKEGMQGRARIHCGRRPLGELVRERLSRVVAEELILR
jgi:HlyD family secretion protein